METLAHRHAPTLLAPPRHDTDEAVHDETSEYPDGHWLIFCQHVQSCVLNAPAPMQQTPPLGFAQLETAFVVVPFAPHVHVSDES